LKANPTSYVPRLLSKSKRERWPFLPLGPQSLQETTSDLPAEERLPEVMQKEPEPGAAEAARLPLRTVTPPLSEEPSLESTVVASLVRLWKSVTVAPEAEGKVEVGGGLDGLRFRGGSWSAGSKIFLDFCQERNKIKIPLRSIH